VTLRVKRLYKEFLVLVKSEYPWEEQPSVKQRVKAAFIKRNSLDLEQRNDNIEQGYKILESLHALCRLRKYRTLRKRYDPF